MEIGNIILGTDDFWLLILVIAMLICKRYQLGVIALLAARLINGRITWWSMAIIIIFAIIMDGMTAASNKQILDKTIKQLDARIKRIADMLGEDDT